MKEDRRIQMASMVLVAIAATACSAGSGSSDVGRGYENSTGRYERPGEGNGGGTATPSPGGDQGGTNNPRDNGGDDLCDDVCGESFECTVNAGGETGKQDLDLSEESGGSCSVENGATLKCDGTVTYQGQDAGTWSKRGERVTVTIAISGQSATFDCKKK